MCHASGVAALARSGLLSIVVLVIDNFFAELPVPPAGDDL